ncbi:unnamed protein product [Prunus armeniaca]|uniref:BAH domain-containing protein n=1 Tax=Prunus armeniaca TaxID=36596 RepID=A0A6J5WU82_PRUAR|nr:unnamed protein product [Prunus armeniaca]
MVGLEETNMEDDYFNWGKKGGVGEVERVQFYESFTLEGMEYSLYDCVHFYRSGCCETDIGKLVEIYDTEDHEKKIKVVWFFRPPDIHNFLGDWKPCRNEILLASGVGQGLSNVNPLEAIVQKCNVVCTSKDVRNPQPSEEELRMASYIFSHNFDVGKRQILENFPDEISGIKVECFFNKRNNQQLFRLPKFQTNLTDPAGPSNVPSKLELDEAKASPVKNKSKESMVGIGEQGCASNEMLRLKLALDGNGTQSARISHGQDKERHKVRFVDQPHISASDCVAFTKGDTSRKKPDGVAFTKGDASRKKPDIDKRSWFKQPSWEEKLQRAQDAGHLVLLDNLDPSYASSEVEALVWKAFREKVEAKMIQYSTFSTPQYGKAFVIFKSKITADRVISELNGRCLVSGNWRPVIGIRRSLKGPDKTARFVGHLSIAKVRLQSQREGMRNAVSTSHCSQPNTIEYDMALEWCLQQEKSDACWKNLYEKQMEEIREARKAITNL